MAMAAVDAFYIAQPVRWSQLSSSSCSSSNAHLIQPTVPMTTMSSSTTMSPTPSRTTAMPLRNAIFILNASANDNNNGSNNKNDKHYEGNNAASYQEETTTTPSSSSSSSSSAISIGDVVQSLHGGKYQFNSNHQYSLAGSSMMGQQFAASLYSSDNSNSNNNSYTNEEGVLQDEEGLGSGKEEPLPKWVRRLKDPKYHNIGNKLSITETLRFDNTDTINTISIANEERSWEKYHVFLLRFKGDNDDDYDDDDDSVGDDSVGEDYDAVVPPSKLFRISPTFGHLAPRGGASNVCDESKPYSDSACITVEWIGDGNDNYDGTGAGNTGSGTHGSGDNDNGRLLLVVGTEADTWRYMLQTPTTPP